MWSCCLSAASEATAVTVGWSHLRCNLHRAIGAGLSMNLSLHIAGSGAQVSWAADCILLLFNCLFFYISTR